VASTALAVLVCSSLEFFTVNRKTRHYTHREWRSALLGSNTELNCSGRYAAKPLN
jgi:hypothetical protein